MKPWPLLSLFLPIVLSICFKEQFAPFRRLPLGNATKVLDFLHCKILCAKAVKYDLKKFEPTFPCLAFAYDYKVSACALLQGPSSNLTCSAPVKEWLKIESKEACPILEPTPLDEKHVQNPRIQEETQLKAPSVTDGTDKTATPCGAGVKVLDLYLYDGAHKTGQNNYNTKLEWDDRLGTWIFGYFESAIITYIRSVKCYEPTLIGPQAPNTYRTSKGSECSELSTLYVQGQTGVFEVPIGNQSMACPISNAPYIWYSVKHNPTNIVVAATDFFPSVACINEVWFWIGPLFGIIQTSYFEQASCTSFLVNSG